MKTAARETSPGSVGRLSDIEEKLVRKGTLRKDGARHKGLSQKREEESGARMVRAVGCHVGGLKEGARQVAKGKGTIPLASSLEPRACCEAVIQFTGGSL